MAKVNRQDILNVIYADGNIEPTLQYMTDNIVEVVNGLDDAIELTDDALLLLTDQVATNTVDIASILAISYPNVDTFALLPDATLNTDKLYVVKNTTGRINPFTTTRWSGLYKSDGVDWNFLGIDIPAIQQLVDNLANSLATVATTGDYNDLINQPTIPPTAPVDSVNGQTGIVVLDQSDIGLGNVDNTSDVDKPVSTATQTALNLKYNASNPNGYETPAELDVRDSNDRARANHTGTQLASTISDFNTAASSAAPVQSVAGKTGTVTIQKADITDFSDADYATAAQGSTADTAVQPEDLGAVATSNDYNDLDNLPTIPGPAPVDSVNGQTGAVVLDKADIGLSNVDNTSDANKPVSTATQTALDLKYNASNPNGYETPAQLNTRDTNNRNRVNHTGTQLASTISDFAATVRSTILTGLSLATSTAVTAADTVLISIGKLQAQITAKVFGNEFESLQSTTSFSTSSTTAVTAYSFTTASKPIGTYRVGVQFNFRSNNAVSLNLFGLFVDGVQQKTEIISRATPTTAKLSGVIISYITFASAATHLLELQASVTGNTVTITDCTIEIWRVS